MESQKRMPLTEVKRIFAVAGEPSGDIHAAHVLEALGEKAAHLEFRGFGGKHMAKAGMTVIEDLAANAVMGLFPVIKALPEIRRWFRIAKEDLIKNRPDALLLVDYPGFNLRLAKIARDLGIPVIYYISPQVWAWNQRRVNRIRKLVDLMIVILPFEQAFYEERGVTSYYAGHPLADRLALRPANATVVSRLKQEAGTPKIGLFPGSRPHVVQTLAPEFLKAAQELIKTPGLENSKFLIAAADKNIATIIKGLPEISGLNHSVMTGCSFEVMSACDVALTTSGTTTLELAGHLTPMILAYKVSPILLTVGRLVVKVPHIGLVNLIAEKGIVPEHIGTNHLWQKLAPDLVDLVLNKERQVEMIRALKDVVTRLESPGSYRRTADRIVAFLEK